MEISYDPAKRTATLAERGLDFEDFVTIYDEEFVTVEDDRSYDEVRMITYGWINGRAVAAAWTDRGDIIRVISMRHMHQKEIERVNLGPAR